MTLHLGVACVGRPRPVSIGKRKKRCLLSSAERGRFHGARSSVAESDRPPVLLLGTSHMIGEIVMTAEAGAVCLSARLRGHLSAVGAVEDVVGVRCVCMAAPTGEGSIIGLKS